MFLPLQALLPMLMLVCSNSALLLMLKLVPLQALPQLKLVPLQALLPMLIFVRSNSALPPQVMFLPLQALLPMLLQVSSNMNSLQTLPLPMMEKKFVTSIQYSHLLYPYLIKKTTLLSAIQWTLLMANKLSKCIRV
jgi:hypothetical protein